jgi:hypothetical protein
MRYTFIAAVALVGQAVGIPAPCPFHAMKRTGLLDDGDLRKYDAVKRDSSMAEKLMKAHRRSDAFSSRSPTGALDVARLLLFGSARRRANSTAGSSSTSSPKSGPDGLDLSELTNLLGGLGKRYASMQKRANTTASASSTSSSSSGSELGGLGLEQFTSLLSGLGKRDGAGSLLAGST